MSPRSRFNEVSREKTIDEIHIYENVWYTESFSRALFCRRSSNWKITYVVSTSNRDVPNIEDNIDDIYIYIFLHL